MANTKKSKGLSRRDLFKVAGAGALVAGTGLGVKLTASKTIAAEGPTTMTGDEVLKMLMEGNQRYVGKKPVHPDQGEQRIVEVARGQHPFAIILGCADSRVSPEILFDEGLGDLFVIRVAGNIVDDAIIGSIEYAAEEFKVPLVMVLGHERCGAITATLKGGELPGHIRSLAEAIQPAVASVREKPGDAIDNAVRANVQMVVEALKSSEPLLSELVKSDKLKIVGGRYDLDSGMVDLIA